jgi:hypothetical protein
MSNPTIYGYLQRPYLWDPYLTGGSQSAYGMQVKLVIATTDAVGVQTKMAIATGKSVGVQVKAQAQGIRPLGFQVKGQIAAAKQYGVQVKGIVANVKPYGVQVKAQTAATDAVGVQVKAQTFGHDPVGVQVKGQITKSAPYGAQVKAQIRSFVAYGMQVKSQIQASAALGVQVKAQAAKRQAFGMQTKGQIRSSSTLGVQVKAQPQGASAFGVQTKAQITSKVAAGVQARLITGGSRALGLQANKGNFAYWDINGYLVLPYLTGPYLAEWYAAQGGIQVKAQIFSSPIHGMQVRQVISTPKPYGMQVKSRITTAQAFGAQLRQMISHPKPYGVQVKGLINFARAYGIQVFPDIHRAQAFGMQVARVEGQVYGVQVTVVLYNTTNLRILYNFPSRGNGSNWVASSTAPGDFNANNLNTDIVEQQWRSMQGSVVSVTLDCDTGVTSVFVDTIAILNHNLTTTAVLVLEGSNVADQSVVGVTIPIEVTKTNIIYVAPTLPLAGYRYWRFVINDPTNPTGQLQIGTIVFGNSVIFEGDNITDSVKLKKVHFADRIKTEGYTDVVNDRALKRAVEINFKNLNYENGNYTELEAIFDLVRTSLKALWIPDPQAPTRFGVFGKISELPDEQHNNLGVGSDYIDITLNIDESL